MSKDAKSEVVLALDNVRSGYGRMEVLRGVSLHVCRGEVVCLIGANGAGKSTTLNTVCGLVRVRSGEIRLFGENTADFTRDRLVRNGLSQVPEGRKLFPDMTVQENLMDQPLLMNVEYVRAVEFQKVNVAAMKT